MKYEIVPESWSHHCCFTHSIIKGTEMICETFSEENAKLICDALNYAAFEQENWDETNR